MPIYTYICEKCQRKIELIAHHSKYQKTIQCDECGSECQRSLRDDLTSGFVKLSDHELKLGHLAKRNSERFSNDYKAELIITKETTRNQLQKLAKWFKERKNINIDYSDSEFYPNGKIKNYNLKVNCNDGFEGTSSSKGINIGNKTHGFIRIYDSEDDKTPFKIW